MKKYSGAVLQLTQLSNAISFPERRYTVVSAPYFLATKLETFEVRGAVDYLANPDLEDIITVIDGSVKIIDEISRTKRLYIWENTRIAQLQTISRRCFKVSTS